MTDTTWCRYDRLPEAMQDAARRYIEQRRLPGHFLQAVLCNDLVEAVSRADRTNLAAIADWASWLYNDIPRGAWGSREQVDAWCAGEEEQ